MSSAFAEQDYLRGLIPQLAQARHGGKGRIIERACDFLSLSRPQIFRKLKDLGYDSKRKTRADRGQTKLTDQELRTVAGILLESTRANGKRLMSFKTAIEIARANGILTVDISTSRLSELLEERGMHPDQLAAPSAHVQLASLHPNHVWQLDASVCVLYYLKQGGGMCLMEEEEFYKNKPQNILRVSDQRVIRYVITDHYSGSIHVEYFMGSESAENLTAFFLRTIQQRDNELLHGVPFLLMIDPGSANTSGLFKNLLERLHVNWEVHKPGAARVNGQVENGHNLVECNFECRLAFMEVHDIAQLNEAARAWRSHYNAIEQHSRHGHTRWALWATIGAEQLRLPPAPEICRELVTTLPVPATVAGNLRVRHAIKGYGSQEYDVRFIPGIAPRQKLDIVINPYRAPAIDVVMENAQGETVIYTVEPMKKNAAGFALDAPVIGRSFAAQPDSVSDKALKDIRYEAYGQRADTDRDVKKLRKEGAIPYGGDINPMADIEQATLPAWMPKRGTLIDISPAPREVAPLSHVAAAKELKARGVAWERTHMQLLEQRYPDGKVPVPDLDALVNELSAARGLQRVVGVRRA